MQLREIQLRRREPKSHLPVPVINNSKRKIGSHFVGRAPLRGLTPEQEVKYLPPILGIDSDDRDWSKRVSDFWADFGVKVPSEGVVLNITLVNGEPINVVDWITYQWCLKHKFVAQNFQELRRNPVKEFYIYDPEEVEKTRHKKTVGRMKAYQELIKMVSSKNDDDKAKSRRVLRMLSGAGAESLTDEQVQNRLEAYVQEDHNRFYEIVTDKDLDIRAEIDEMLELSVLNRIGNHILFLDDIIGESMEEAIQFFKGKSNSQTITVLKSKLVEARNTRTAA
jgi:hypothetical protein